jgi:superfamily II DNA or RNA helicase
MKLPHGVLKQSESWEQFQTHVAALANTKEKGDAFERLCQLFLQTDSRYKELKSVWLLKEVPASIAVQINLPGPDEGIDGIAQTVDGEFWSWQAKYRDNPKQTLTKNDLDGFSHLSFTYCKGIVKALVMHTSSEPIKKHKLLQISEIGLREFESLDAEAWKRIHAAMQGKFKPRPPRKPRPHQVKAIKQIIKHLLSNSRGRVLMPCGTGKSLVGFWVQKSLKAKQVVVAVPSLALLNQTLRDWADEWAANGQTVRYTVVASDESSADLGDTFVGETYELGIDVHTDTARIAKRLKDLRKQHHVVFTTYHSSHKLAEAAKRAGITFDLGILDEAHKTVGHKRDRFATLLDERKIRIRKRLAMTATERVLRGKNDDVLSMDDHNVYGKVAFLYTFKQAIKDERICDYKIITLTVSESRIRALIQANKNVSLKGKGKIDRIRQAQDVAAGELLTKAFEQFGVRHAISFHRSIDAAMDFTDQWDVVGKMVRRKVSSESFHVSSRIPTGKRVSLLRDFRESQAAVISNARCLTEGVDVPNVDAILFADPRKSQVDIVQAVGRALRRDPNNLNKIGYVLLPVVVPDDQTVEQFLESGAFKEIGRVLATLSIHDDRIAEEFRISDSGEIAKGSESRILVMGDVPVSVGEMVSASEFAKQCRAKMWEKVGRLNWRPFEEAREFVRGLGLKNLVEWNSYCDGELKNLKELPSDIPTAPQSTYVGKGWKGAGDWLGTGRIATQFRQYQKFERARAFARKLKIKNYTEWRSYCRGDMPLLAQLPKDIPRAPQSTYRDTGWISFGDWFGTAAIGTSERIFRPFREAKAFARKLKLQSSTGWYAYCRGKLPLLEKLPLDIPTSPNRTYADKGWSGMGDWLGTGTIAPSLRKYRSFEQARKFARSLKFKSGAGWKLFCKGALPQLGTLPKDIPTNPNATYGKSGWLGMGDWLGTGRIADQLKTYRPFKEAREFVHKLNLKKQKEWYLYCQGKLPHLQKLPSDIPATPNNTYSDKGWINFGDWLGTGVIAHRLRQYRSFNEARAFAQSLNLKKISEWQSFCKGELPHLGQLPADIPSCPNTTYAKKGWRSVGDWLGTGSISSSNRIFRPFQDARKFIRSLKLKNNTQWRAYCTGKLNHLGKLPSDIPAAPDRTYRDQGWISYGDWLGTGNIGPGLRKFRSFIEARKFVRSLKLKGQKEWIAFTKGELPALGKLPIDIPATPSGTYSDKGWINFGDWLGTGYIGPRQRKYRSFNDARKFARSLKLKSKTEWEAFTKGLMPHLGKLPSDIPAAPSMGKYANNGWNGFKDWLGTND